MSKDFADLVVETWAQELPGVVGDELALAKRASRVSGLLAERVDAELARMGLTKAEYEILAVLRSAGEPYRLRPSDLAKRLMLSSGGTSNLLRRLTAAELVDRDPDPDDARSSWVALTPHGVKTAEEAVRAASKAQAALLRSVPAETTAEAIRALRALLIALGDTP
ncbi:MarR family winged helix-turn-helix transcriptional regulator [Cryptosporangium aurantiacum]|uniref:DNA-binding transcriptional regulator, MarR family n=1 Tax=Cryptosporangium aurantiacum TaxID=134849 RepID=A0A1M7M8L7_9ACTN|nr:MarR family transcriptional regulator [Cryptosporangium aurantiacum]SHM87085.1 DNA-binding transcriptional regulator, MarR family [Cryptosporangium aurantiacum]